MSDDILYYIWLSGLRNVTRREKISLLRAFGSPGRLFHAKEDEIKEAARLLPDLRIRRPFPVELTGKDSSRAEKDLTEAERFGAGICVMGAEDYPRQLLDMPDPPIAFFYRGRIEIVREPGIAIVGTRRCSPYGRWAAAEISKRVAAAGGTVISGMAAGIDSAAHEGCLSRGGPTAAVFGTGLDVCFPASNEKLYRRIIEEGLIISEYGFGEPGIPRNFPERNRIISGLCSKMVVVEGSMKSGSMISAGLALDQGREVFAVPGNINQPCSIGVNRLIADGACPIMDLDTVPELLGLGSSGHRAKVLAAMSADENKVFETVRQAPGIGADAVVVSCGYDPATALALITGLEIKGLLRREGPALL